MLYDYFLEDMDLLQVIEYKRLFKKEPEIIGEGLLNKLPQDIRDLKTDIKEYIKELKNEKSSKKEYSKSIIQDICKKYNIEVINIQDGRSHQKDSKVFTVYGIYKDYIIDILFNISYNNDTSSLVVKMVMINVDYDKNKCVIPKNVAFDIVNNFNTSKIWRISSEKNFIEVVSHNKSTIDSIYNKIQNKYSKDYNIEKSSDGLSMKIYTKN